MYLKSTNAKKQANLIAENIDYRIKQALLHEGEKLIIFEEILLDKGDLILNAMYASEDRDYGQQFVLTARLLHKKNLNDSLQLIAYNNISYTYPAEGKTEISADDTAFLNQIRQKNMTGKTKACIKFMPPAIPQIRKTPNLFCATPYILWTGPHGALPKCKFISTNFCAA